jgi:SAM-dependent methyltransferase
MSLRSAARSGLLSVVSALTGRHAVLLPPEAVDEAGILTLQAPYRVEGDTLVVKIAEPETGRLRMALLGYQGHFPTMLLWNGTAEYNGPCDLTLGVTSGAIGLGGTLLGEALVPLPTRRFCWRLDLETGRGTKRRTTGHYLTASGNGSYYDGGNYVDYEAEARGDVDKVLALVEEHGARGPVLEVGCATGLMLEALASKGLEVYGLDSSPWAVEEARKRVGAGRVFQGDPDRATLPAPLAERGPFGTLLLWAVLEHFRDPFRVLSDLTRLTSRGAVLLINTTNARSLSHLLYGDQWEGYFDASHHGVDAVSVDTLRSELPALGWRIESLQTHLSWDSSADPTRAALREWWAADARFRRLLVELDRGDLVTVVALRE